MNEKLRLNVVSDGTLEGTKLMDEDGRVCENVIHISYMLDLDGNPQVSLTLVGIPVDITYTPTMVDDLSP